MSTPPNEGWFGPAASRRFHYFGADGRSLCGKWIQPSPPQAYGIDWNTSLGKASGDCAACAHALAKRYPLPSRAEGEPQGGAK